jgi:hypothetical protein
MSGRKWCEKCGELEAMANPFPWIPSGEARAHRAGCPGGHVIPIATLCNPPEPTVIDASDLAPGMVVVAVDELCISGPTPASFVCSPDAHLYNGIVIARCFASIVIADAEDVRFVAGGRGRP